MNIVHFAPFAPCACGLYEAARDMVVADRDAGHNSNLVDIGLTTTDGQYIAGAPGKEDARGERVIISADIAIIRDADVLIAHSGVPDNWLSPYQTPMIWMLHGRPRICFSPEQFKRGHSFTLMANIASWPRVKAVVTFWPAHTQYWSVIVPKDKLVTLSAPPIDCKRFSVEGVRHDYSAMSDKINIILADSWREDIDLYEITNGAIEFARNNEKQDVKFHFFGVQEPLGCWEYLMAELRLNNALGEVWSRRANMQEVYRAASIVLSPHRITTRVIGEALCCGTPVIAANGNLHATWTCTPDDPSNVSKTITYAIDQMYKVGDKVEKIAQEFSLEKYNKAMEKIYATL